MPINNNKIKDDIKPYNYYNNERWTNINNFLEEKRKNYLVNKYFSTDNIFFNSSQNKNEVNKELLLNCNNNQNVISNKEKINKKILVRSNNNYRTLYEREKEKVKNIWNIVNRHSLNDILRNYDSINLLNKSNNNTKVQMSLENRTLNSNNKIENTNQKTIIKNISYNNTIDNSTFNKNKKISNSISSIKKNLFKNNINRYKLLNNNNSAQNNRYKNNSNENNNLYNKYKGNPKFIKFQIPKEYKNYKKSKINISPSINNLNDILSTDNRIPYINFYSLNNNTFNKGNEISLTEQDRNIKFTNIYDYNFLSNSKKW